MEIDPNSEDFVHSVLMPLSMRLKNGEDEQVLKDELLTLVLPWVRQQVSSNIRRIPVNADPANVSSHMHEAAFKAVAKIDWQQIDKWPMYLGSLVRHSAQEAARDDDYLSRQQRVLRKQFRNACIAEETKQQSPITIQDRERIALVIAEGQAELANELLVSWHPREVSTVPDSMSEQISVEDEVEQQMVKQKIKNWLENELPEDIRNLVIDWMRLPRANILPARLEKQLQPYILSLMNAVDDFETSEIFAGLYSQDISIEV